MKSFTTLLLTCNLITIFSSNFGIVEGIVGGRRVQQGSFKYQLSVQGDDKHICGGALISDQHALTAANCFIGDDERFIDKVYKVVGGVNDLNNINKVTIIVERISIPRNYKRTGNDPNDAEYISPLDIAVLTFPRRLPFTHMSLLQVVFLPQQATVVSKYSKEQATATGYGIEDHREGDENKAITEVCEGRCLHLNAVVASVMLKRSCESIIFRQIDDTHLCARVPYNSENRAGLCFGDIGAPLIFQHTVIGILIKHRTNCKEGYFPSIYTATSTVLDFITKAKANAYIPALIRIAQRRVTPTMGITEV